jgi:hypothetical protein
MARRLISSGSAAAGTGSFKFCGDEPCCQCAGVSGSPRRLGGPGASPTSITCTPATGQVVFGPGYSVPDSEQMTRKRRYKYYRITVT